VYGVPEEVLEGLRASGATVHRKLPGDKSRRFYRVAAADGTSVDVLDDSWTQYRRKGFLPAGLVKRLGLEEACARGRLRTYYHGAMTETPVTWASTRLKGTVTLARSASLSRRTRRSS
jgi:hypothetical protein